MAMVKNHPKKCKYCVFCHYWTGDAKMKFANPIQGFEYDNCARGKCVKKNTGTQAGYSCSNFSPSVDASKLL